MSDSWTTFVLTKRAASQGRNMHIFALTHNPVATIAGGLNLNRFSVQAKTFYRWFHLCNDWLNPPSYALNPTIVLRPITLQPLDVMVYGVDSVDGPAIPRDSLEVIQPGSYGIFSSDGTPYTDNVNCIQLFRYNFEEEIEACRRYAYPRTKSQASSVRSLWRATKDVASSQDAPIKKRNHRNETTLTMHRHVDNIVTVSSSLAPLFRRNAFTVDIEEAARVIQFEDLPDALPSHCPVLLQSASEPSGARTSGIPSRCSSPAGRADYQPGLPAQARALTEELEEDLANLDDAKWKTPLGKEVFRVFLTSSLLDPVEESDDDDTDDVTSLRRSRNARFLPAFMSCEPLPSRR
uniref:Uncharacterized protein n=1 Tax=Mycena chlorophos TaxID=658473 RepID=A0ABQ0M3J5_MYCCL|nr:predicted protein [Mycena chlorophos]